MLTLLNKIYTTLKEIDVLLAIIWVIWGWIKPLSSILARRVKVLVLSDKLSIETFSFFKFKQNKLSIKTNLPSLSDIKNERAKIIIIDYGLLESLEEDYANCINKIIDLGASVIIYTEKHMSEEHKKPIETQNNKSSTSFIDISTSKSRMLMCLKQMIDIEVMRGKHD